MLASSDIKWDVETEVIVIGYGMAGAVAAITARDKGADVVVLEKQNADSHCTNSSLSGGLFACPTEVSGAIEYLTALSQSGEQPTWTDADTIRVWSELAVQNRSWMQALGARVKFIHKGGEHPGVPGCDSMEFWQYPGKGLRMMRFMYRQARVRNIKIRYQIIAQRLLTNVHGTILGVRATAAQNGAQEELNIRARKAVILCSGGFEDDEAMKLQYLRLYPIYFTGQGMGNTGDGIRMAQEVGADLWHMNCCSAGMVAKFPELSMGFGIEMSEVESSRRELAKAGRKAPSGFITVNRHGCRYLDENFKRHSAWYQMASYDANRLEYPGIPSFHIFDSRRMAGGPIARLSGAAGPHQIYRWSRDNRAELAKGWILRGDCIAELGERIGVSPASLEETVRRWNGYCDAGVDPEFGRDPVDLVPLDQPPYFAIKVFPGGPNTQGGPRRNSRAQVLNPFSQPIPRLYAAGECGSVYGMLYPSAGSNLAECIVFGRLAGENAAAEATCA